MLGSFILSQNEKRSLNRELKVPALVASIDGINTMRRSLKRELKDYFIESPFCFSIHEVMK